MVGNYFPGYNFPTKDAIRPYLEPAGRGPSADWARETARRLRCKVCVGYPEIELATTTAGSLSAGTEEGPGPASREQEKCYNSLIVVDENGEVVLNYRKAFLYYTDETWAEEGDVERGVMKVEFGGGHGELKRVDTAFGICMDINPYKFEAPFTAWEFANRVLDSRSQLVVLSMAWLTLLSKEELDALADKPEMDTFNYWIQRFLPLIKRRMSHGSEIDGNGNESSKKIIIVFANRTGEEPSTGDKPPARYAGTSAIIAVTQRAQVPAGVGQSGPGDDDPHASGEDGNEDGGFEVKILCWDLMGATTEGICFADTAAEPEMVFGLVKAKR